VMLCVALSLSLPAVAVQVMVVVPLQVERGGDPEAVVRPHALVEPAQQGDEGRARVAARARVLGLGHLADGRGDHVGLRRVAPVDRGAGDAGLGRDGLDRRAVVALAPEHAQRRGDDLAVGRLVAGAAGAAVCRFGDCHGRQIMIHHSAVSQTS